MNKLAYDLALLCVEHGLKYAELETCQESARFALETFKTAYSELEELSKPFLDSFGAAD